MAFLFSFLMIQTLKAWLLCGQEYRFGFEAPMMADDLLLEAVEEEQQQQQQQQQQLMQLKKKKKNATRRMEQIIRLHTEGNRAKIDQARI